MAVYLCTYACPGHNHAAASCSFNGLFSAESSLTNVMVGMMSRNRTAIIAVAVILMFATLVGPGLVLGPQIDVETVVQQDFVQSVVATGRVETPHRASIGVRLTGVVQHVLINEGEFVAAGDTLIEVESAELRAALDQAQRAERAAVARVREMREVQSPSAAAALQQAQVTYNGARDALRRSQSLFAAGAISASALEDAQRTEQIAEARLRSAEQQAASAQPSGSAAAEMLATLEQAQAGVRAARARLAYATVVAPITGTVITRDVEPGDVVQPGRTVMELSPKGETQLVVVIDEKQLRLLKPGLTALASADAYPDDRFTAHVVSISPSVDAQRGTVTVKLDVASPPAYLKQDMTVSVDIEIARKTDAVLVPTSAVHDLDTASPWVLKVVGRRAQRQSVTLGLRSDGLCEVLSGLNAGDQVVPVNASSVANQSRLRPVQAP